MKNVLHIDKNFKQFITEKIFFSVIFLFPLLGSSQPFLVKGKIVDSLNNPIPYTSIYDSISDQGTYSDINGYFILEVIKLPITLRFSNVGYNSKMVEIVNSKSKNIMLDEKVINLNKITITAEQYRSKYLGSPKKEKGLFTHRAWDPFDQIGIMVNNKNNVLYNNPHLISFSIKVGRWSYLGSKLGVKPSGKRQLRLRLYEIDDKNLAGKDILHENVFLSPSKKGWYTIDIEDKNIVLPDEGFVMAVEWIEDNVLYTYKAKSEKGKKHTNRQYGIGISSHKISDEEKVRYTPVWLLSIRNNTWEIPWHSVDEYMPCFRLKYIELD